VVDILLNNQKECGQGLLVRMEKERKGDKNNQSKIKLIKMSAQLDQSKRESEMDISGVVSPANQNSKKSSNSKSLSKQRQQETFQREEGKKDERRSVGLTDDKKHLKHEHTYSNYESKTSLAPSYKGEPKPNQMESSMRGKHIRNKEDSFHKDMPYSL